MVFSIPRTSCACLLLLATVAWAWTGAESVHASTPAGPAATTRERAHAEHVARARNRGPGSVDFYEYVGVSMNMGPLEPNGFSIDAAEGMLWRGDSAVGLRLCDKADDFHCFHGPALSFAVPKAPMSVGQSWSRFGRKYAVIAQGPMHLLGRSIDVHVIESVDDLDRKRWFYFSDQFGLVAVAFRSREGTTTETFYSKGQYGYPRAAPAAADGTALG
jgi:hypothetical protein